MENNNELLHNLQSKLRSLSLLYKELQNRHNPSDELEENRIYKLIYSQTDEKIFNKDSDAQAEFRDDFFEKISEIPSNPLSNLYVDELLSEFLSIESNITPPKLRVILKEFFKARISYYNQFKFKLLLEWTHKIEFSPFFSISSDIEASDKLLDDSTERYHRLCADDEFDKNYKKPVPKTSEGTNLYLHADNILYTSVSKEDINIYLQAMVHQNNSIRKFQNFMISLKWIHIGKRFEIWEQMVENLMSVRRKSTNRMHMIMGQDLSSVTNLLKSFKKKLVRVEVPGIQQEIEMPQNFLTDISQLQGIIEGICQEFGLKGDMELDDGHSLAYQVSHLFPELYEVQKHKLEWIEYGNRQAKIIASKKLSNLQFMKSHRLSYIRKFSSFSDTDIPPLKSFEIASKKACDWILKIKYKPQIYVWERQQNIKLKHINQHNELLKNAFASIDEQDITESNRFLEQLASKYTKFTNEKKVLNDPNQSKAKKYFSILLAEFIKEKNENEVILPSQTIKTLYTLVLLKQRNLKNKLISVLNVFRSIEKRITLDLNDIELREDFGNSKISEQSCLKDRRDKIEEIDEELYVKDSKGEYIAYDCVLEDYSNIKNFLLTLGTYYIEKYEKIPSDNFFGIDFQFLACDLLEMELKFSMSKYNLISILLYFYNNTIQKSKQESLLQYIMNIMHMRPRLNLRSSYFYESYLAHVESLESQTRLLKSIIQAYPQGSSLVTPLQFDILDLSKLVEENYWVLSLLYKIECPKQSSALEQAIWDYAYNTWKESLKTSSYYFNAGILMDIPEFNLNILSKLAKEFEEGRKVRPGLNKDNENISEVNLACNYVTAWELRKILERNIEECLVINRIYQKQYKDTNKDLSATEYFDWSSAGKLVPEIDEGPGMHSLFNLPVFEMDKSLKAFMDFSDLECLKYLTLPWGLEEMYTVTRYQVMEKQILAIAAQVNQIGLDESHRILSELNVACKHQYIPNKYSANWPDIFKKGNFDQSALKHERKKILPRLGKHFLDIHQIKIKNRSNCIEKLKILYNIHTAEKKEYEGPMIFRRLRVDIISDYCLQVLKEVYPYGIKLQIIQILYEYNKLTSFLSPSLFSETYKKDSFYDSERSILNLEVFPSVHQILEYNCKPLEELSISKPLNSLSMFHSKYHWSHGYDLMKIIEGYGAVVQCLHIRLFLNMIIFHSTEILNLSDTISAGEAFWSESVSDPTVKNHENMLEDQITDAFSILKVLKVHQLNSDKEDRLKILISYSRHTFNTLSIALYTTMSNLILSGKKKISDLEEIGDHLFSLNVLDINT